MDNSSYSQDDESASTVHLPHQHTLNTTNSLSGEGVGADDRPQILMSSPLPSTWSPPLSATDGKNLGSLADRQAGIMSRAVFSENVARRRGSDSGVELNITPEQPALQDQPFDKGRGFNDDLNISRRRETSEMSTGIRKVSRGVDDGACLRKYQPVGPKTGFERSNGNQSTNLGQIRNTYDERFQTLQSRIIKELGLDDGISEVSLLKSKQEEVITRLYNAPILEREVLKKIRLLIIQRIRRAETFNRKRLERSKIFVISRDMGPISSEPKPKLPNQYLRRKSKRSGPTKPEASSKTALFALDDWDTELKPHQRKKPTMKGEPNEVEKKLIEAGLDVVPESLDHKKTKRPKNIWETLRDHDQSFFSNLK